MIKLGEYNILKVVKIVDFGVYLDGGEYWGEILLPKETAPAECKEGDELKVFIYFDSEDRVIATMTTPKAIVGDLSLIHICLGRSIWLISPVITNLALTPIRVKNIFN